MPSLWATNDDGGLAALEVRGHATEKDFQEVLAKSPEVLADAIDGPDARWLLIDRELPIRATDSDVGTWALDHLFVSSSGHPVLVEVKRSGDARARREVVAQMLDYAASFADGWPALHLDARRKAKRLETGPDVEFEEFLAFSDFDDEAEFWALVQSRIDAGELRLLFVADQLSPTLVKIIEFLNDQLRSVDVLGVQVVRHESVAPPALVVYQPVVHGRSSRRGAQKDTAQRISREKFDEAVVDEFDGDMVAVINSLVATVEELGGFESLGTGAKLPTLYLNLRSSADGALYWPLLLSPRRGKLILRLKKLQSHPVLGASETIAQVIARFADAAASPLAGGNGLDRWVPMSVLREPERVKKLEEFLAWVVETEAGE